jgi:hypothetical protein
MTTTDGLGYLSCGFPIMGVRFNGRFYIIPNIGAEAVVKVGVVGVLNIKLRKQRLAVWSRWSPIMAGHDLVAYFRYKTALQSLDPVSSLQICSFYLIKRYAGKDSRPRAADIHTCSHGLQLRVVEGTRDGRGKMEKEKKEICQQFQRYTLS